MIRLAACAFLIMASAPAAELRGRLAAWSGGTGGGLFVILGQSQRYVVGYSQPLKIDGWDRHKRLELGFWVRIPTQPTPREFPIAELFAERLIVEAPADAWITATRQYMDELLMAIFVSGDREKVRKLLGKSRSDVEDTVSWFIERRRAQALILHLSSWVIEEIHSHRLKVLSDPVLCEPLASLSLELRSDGRKVIVEHATRVDPERYESLFSDEIR
jgi:hypothetical protein